MFQFEIGQTVWVYTTQGYEQATILSRFVVGSINMYQVDIFMNPQNEAFLRK